MAATTFPPSGFPTRQQRWQPVPSVQVEETTTPFQRLGFSFLLVFLFLAFSRIFDVKFSSLHITGVSYRIVFAMTLLSGGALLALKTPVGRALLGFTFFFALSVPFSIWRGGSIPVFRDTWLLFSFVAFLATAGLACSYDQVKKSIYVMAWALFVFVIIANVFGKMDSGRLILTRGRFANPNEMAQALLIGIPLWWAKMSAPGSRKLFPVGVMLLMLATVLRTGSRGAMIGFAAMCLVVFVRASVAGKVQMLVGVVALGGLVIVAMPGKLVSRYKTITNEQETGDMDESMRDSALGSTESRKLLLKHSIIFTLQHPLFGVGPGMFPVADDRYDQSQGKHKGQWLGTHNSYTEVSSELGIPAVCFFIAAIVMALRGPYRLYLRTRDDPRTADIGIVALGLHYSMVIYVVTIFFEHIAYTAMLPVFGGFAAALMRVADQEIARRLSTPLPEPQVAVTPRFRTYSRQKGFSNA